MTSKYDLHFGASRIVMTSRGERKVSDAPATEAFWTAWRADKQALKTAGYAVGKNDAGEWKVTLWQETGSREERAANIEASRATSSSIEIPVPAGMAMFPFQKAGVAFASSRPATLFGDEMGLGKTVQAIATANAAAARKILVVAPASLLLNWRREIGRWQTLGLPVHVIRPGCPWPSGDGWFVINYDIAGRYPAMKQVAWDVIVMDETHYLKNPKAKRTRFLLGGGKGSERVEPVRGKIRLLLTGTPILNRPGELFTLLQYLDPVRWTSQWSFRRRYCGAFDNGWGLQDGEPTNLDELQERLRSTVMVRRLKAEVLTELPAKFRQLMLVEVEGAEQLLAAERAAEARTAAAVAAAEARLALLDENHAEYKAAVEALTQARGIQFSETSRVRHETALAKVPAVIEHLGNTSGKVVVFAWHRDVIEQLRAAVEAEGVVVITGDTPIQDRDAAVERFQTDPSCRFFLGNMKAAGVGLTLTAASHVIFAESDWVPANLTQAEDRCHRIGQRESVLVQHLVVDGSLDARMMQKIIEKQAVADAALDTRHAPREVEERRQAEVEARAETIEGMRNEERAHGLRVGQIVSIPTTRMDRPVEQRAQDDKRAARQALADSLTRDQIDAIHTALQTVAGYDPDRARELNGIGFSRIDGAFGHDLAARSSLSPRQAAAGMRLARKYRRQYPEDLYRRIFGE